jgi:hypothetical protein
VERNNVAVTDMTKYSELKAEQTRYDILPDSLEGFNTTREGSGAVGLTSGHVEHRTGKQPDSWATVELLDPRNYGRLQYDNAAVLQTNIRVDSASGQRAWLLWGDREGPGVGWRIRDDVLEGFAHDGSSAATVPLKVGFDPGTSWNLTAMYNPSEVTYWVEETALAENENVPEGSATATVTTVGAEASYASENPDASGSLSFEPYESDLTGPTTEKVMSVALTNTEPEQSALKWSMWRNHVYPEISTS